MQSPVTIATFYRFCPLEQPASHRELLLQHMHSLNIKGTVTLAPEGINATISGTAIGLQHFVEWLRAQLGIDLPPMRSSHAAAPPFQRAKVKVKRELISIGAPADPSLCVGRYVSPWDWNALITQTDVIVIDTRNDYEYRHGHFTGAINPGTRNFKQMVAFTQEWLDPKAGKRIAMYCTGGIRCEKYSSYLLGMGFGDIYHLHGGILAYLEQIPAAQSLWQGDCFVFDERTAVSHG